MLDRIIRPHQPRSGHHPAWRAAWRAALAGSQAGSLAGSLAKMFRQVQNHKVRFAIIVLILLALISSAAYLFLRAPAGNVAIDRGSPSKTSAGKKS
ncbi:MAG: hypothetical protein U0X75_06910 [Acidobacteriota bacterium]